MTKQRHGQTILIADDEPEVVDLVRMILEWEGFAVAEAQDGEEALVKARETGPDLILLDVRMPRMSGLDVLKRLHRDRSLAKIPVVMLSVVTTYPDVQEALERGAIAYISKPFELKELVRLVTRVLDLDAAGRDEFRKNALKNLGA